MTKHIRILLLFSIILHGGISKAQLPDDFPGISTEISGETGKGSVFLAVATEVEGIGYYLIILDNDGSIDKYKELEDDYAYDFKMQPNGQLSYAQFLSHHSYTGGGNVIHKIMDRDLNQVDSIQLVNDYIAESHDFQALPNGHFLAFGYYLTQTDMSKVVEGAHPAAFVSGGIVQEFDADKNLVWQWRSWDHHAFEDYPFNTRRAKGEYVSAFHLNTIGLDYDGNLLLATPSWTRKISRQTGESIWQIGGDDNDFSFSGVDSSLAVDHLTGHAFYLLENGNYLIYDNGGKRMSKASSEVHEYSLDQENKVATHVWSYARTQDTIAAWHRGNAYRLPNGNTMIGWGGADGAPIPTATEVDNEGNVMFEAWFDSPAVESYRAFRFDLNVNTPYASDWYELIVPGGDYDFVQGDTLDTGISVHVDDRTGDGYNTLEISRYNYAPMYPVFPERAPLVKAKRIVMEGTGISSIHGQITFDVDEFNIFNPEEITIYYRAFPGSGLFVPLSTSYNNVLRIIQAGFTGMGEFIITWPDVEELPLPPLPVDPIQEKLVNQEYPVRFEWAPDGFIEEFDLQISADEAFTSIVEDVNVTQACIYEWQDALNNHTYYWRVRTRNGAGDSEWSDTAVFSTSPPRIQISAPNGNDSLQIGLEYWIQWEDNILEDVIIELYKGDVFDQVIDTVPSTGAYQWALPVDFPTGTDFAVGIKSEADGSIYDLSDAHFSIIDTVTTAIAETIFSTESLVLYPNPSEGPFHIRYMLKEPADVSISLFDLTGRLVRNLYAGTQAPGWNEVSGNLETISQNLYIVEIRADDQAIRKVLLVL